MRPFIYLFSRNGERSALDLAIQLTCERHVGCKEKKMMEILKRCWTKLLSSHVDDESLMKPELDWMIEN